MTELLFSIVGFYIGWLCSGLYKMEKKSTFILYNEESLKRISKRLDEVGK